MMKRIFMICVVLILMISSCQTDLVWDESRRPILFSPPLTGTSRGASLNSLEGKTFGVRAYAYDTGWESEKAEALPDAEWDDTEVSCEAGGLCNYSPVRHWQHNKNYAFLAYYPYSANSEGTVRLKSSDQINGHILNYTLHPQANKNMDKMYDVMYAHSTDLNEVNTSKVGFTFRHCLFGLQLVIDNLNNYPASEPKPYINVERLSIQLTNIQYESIDVPLDGGEVVCNKGKQQKDFSYTLINKAVQVPSTLNHGRYDVMPDNHLLLIPQKGLTGNVKIKYNGKRQQTLNIDFADAEMKAGVRYIISLQFIGDQINVILVNADNWSDVQTDVDFE